ncbi:MAG: SUF system NifU family Fe-S cluster assembly protein [Anaerolineae bacterium]|nr:SUF system NifU family Fe-S cluster assembly protein [Gemmatimonadaceae bacterium]
MPDVAELYQSLILDHNRSPRNFRVMADADRSVEGRNPLCGDELTVWLRMDGDTIADVSWMGKGCAISKASASMMTAAVKGVARDDAEALFENFHDLVTGKLGDDKVNSLGRLAAFRGVSRFPIRVKCASLAWHALHSALLAPGTSSAG